MHEVFAVFAWTPEFMVVPLGMIYTRITPSMFQKTVATTLPAEGAALNFFHEEFT
jgi:hypothetical protein